MTRCIGTRLRRIKANLIRLNQKKPRGIQREMVIQWDLQEGYYPSTPSDTLTPYRNECVNILHNNFGILCDNHHHEVATAGQCEIDMRYDYLVNAADGAQSYKYVIRNVAKKFGKVATMMPKPIARDSGSGMHINVSLWRDEKTNAFYDESDEIEISQEGLYFCGGIL